MVHMLIGEAEPPEGAPPVWHEYPKVMVHPHAVKATSGVSGSMDAIRPGDRFPPVTVNNADQEAWHRAQGYVAGGKGDAAAFANAHAGPLSDHVHIEYPKWIGDVLVKSAAEERALIGEPVRQTRHKPTPGGNRGHNRGRRKRA